ncbi:hypothetical protein CASFOL_038235 [Castilleja foliolosa]|uniref:RING-type E3 ubiquitin transferase n=1 Tax=Castilleja foliolosa TaxID=1961234 RepID=A0ABD3BL24_9LAMI
MQRPRSSISMLPENQIYDNDFTSGNAGVDSPIPWNTMLIPSQNPLPDYRIASSGAHSQYQQHASDGGIGDWCLGETSSSAHQYEPHNFLLPDSLQINLNADQTTNEQFLLQNSSGANATFPRDLNMSLESEDQVDDDDCQVIEHPSSCASIGSSNDQVRLNARYTIDEGEDRPGCSLDGQRVSCKRKAREAHVGSSSGAGSSIFLQNNERRQWHSIPENNISIPVPTENSNVVNNNGPELANNGHRLGVGRASSSSPFSLVANGTPESSRRNLRLRINGLHQQDPIMPQNPPLSPVDVGNVDVSSSRHSSRLALRNCLLDLNPSPAVENGNSLHGQSSLLDVPSMRRNHQSRWSSGPSSARSSRSFGTTANALYEELGQRTIPRSIPEHPMFVQPSEMGNSSQHPINWNFSSGGHDNSNNNNNNNAGNVVPTSQVGSIRGESSSTPSWSHRISPQYPQRLSEIVRRSLLLSDRSVSNNNGVWSGSTQETTPSRLPNVNLGRHVPTSSRSALLERHVDGASGIPYSRRTLAALSEGRSSIMSEIRHVLDLMRRGEGLRLEDAMVLDYSALFGMADIHDRHRDMRLDVDNMSYEELLALEERIGNVCTGLTEENILSGLKQRIFVKSKVEDHVETEPCSICREEYNDNEVLGILECGHDFHKECIKQWLVQKNVCPICKTTGLTT